MALLFCYFFKAVSLCSSGSLWTNYIYSPGWPETHRLLQPQSSQCCDYRPSPPHLAWPLFMVQNFKFQFPKSSGKLNVFQKTWLQPKVFSFSRFLFLVPGIKLPAWPCQAGAAPLRCLPSPKSWFEHMKLFTLLSRLRVYILMFPYRNINMVILQYHTKKEVCYVYDS